MKKTLTTLGLASIITFPSLAHAEFKSGFADIGIHYLDWSNRTTEKTPTINLEKHFTRMV